MRVRVRVSVGEMEGEMEGEVGMEGCQWNEGTGKRVRGRGQEEERRR